MTVDIRAVDGDFLCTLFPRESSATEDEVEQLRHLFRAEVNDQILRARVAAQTEALRNLVFAVAFSGTGLAEAEPDPQTGGAA